MRPKSLFIIGAVLIAGLILAHASEESSRKINSLKKKDRQSPLTSLIPVSMVLMLLSLPLLPLMMGGPIAMGLAQPGIQLVGQRLQQMQTQFLQRPLASPTSGAINQQAGPGGIIFRQGYQRSGKDDTQTGWGSSKLVGIVSTVEEVMDKYEVTNPECQRLLMCQMHKKTINPKVGTFTEKLIDLFGVETQLEKTSIGNGTKSFLKDFLRAARAGLGQRDCSSIYRGCRQQGGLYDKKPLNG